MVGWSNSKQRVRLGSGYFQIWETGREAILAGMSSNWSVVCGFDDQMRGVFRRDETTKLVCLYRKELLRSPDIASHGIRAFAGN